MRRMSSWYQTVESTNFRVYLCTRNFLGPGEQLCSIPLIVALSPGQYYTTEFRFVHCQQIRRERKSFGSGRENSKMLFLPQATWMFSIRVQAFRDPLRREVPHVQIFMNGGPNALTWHAHLLSYWFSQNPEVFKNKLVNLINNFVVVSVLGSPGRGVTQVEKSPRLMWATQISTATYCGVCSFCVLSEWRGFLSTCYLAGKKNLADSSRFHFVEIARVARLAYFQTLLQGKTCNSAHEHTPLSTDNTDFVLRHREVSRAGDLAANPHISNFHTERRIKMICAKMSLWKQ